MMSDLYNKWKVKKVKKTKKPGPMIGIIYKGIENDEEVIGILIEMDTKAELRTQDNRLVSVDLSTLKIIT